MRKTSLDMVYELARKDKRVIFIGSDLGKDTLKNFKKSFPDRFFMEGVSEQNIIGMASGLAMNGHIVYVNTIATFLTRRSFEQNAINIGLHKLNVRLLGSGGGCVYAPLGPTHIANDDIAIMNSIPNMTVIAVADSIEMKKMMYQTINHNGPIYIRLGKGNDPIISNKSKKFQIGKGYSFFDGDKITLISTGVTTKICIEIAKKLGTDSQVLHFPTLKPFDEKFLIKKIKFSKKIIVVEEHSKIGGLHSIISSILIKNNKLNNFKYFNFSLPDKFISEYGKQNDILNKYGISVDNIYNNIAFKNEN